MFMKRRSKFVMKSLKNKIIRKIYDTSRQGKKIRKYRENELTDHSVLALPNDSKVVFSVASGRSGQRWLSRLINEQRDWVGTCERFGEYEFYYRWCCYNNVNASFIKDFEKYLYMSIVEDCLRSGNSFVASPCFNFGLNQIFANTNPDKIIWQIRDPIQVIESFVTKNWYRLRKSSNTHKYDFDVSLKSNFSQLLPKNKEEYEWFVKLTRVGKIGWFWSIQNREIMKMVNIHKEKVLLAELSELNTNSNAYNNILKELSISEKKSNNYLKFIRQLKTDNSGRNAIHPFTEWSSQEKRELETIFDTIFSIEEFRNFHNLK